MGGINIPILGIDLVIELLTILMFVVFLIPIIILLLLFAIVRDLLPDSILEALVGNKNKPKSV